MLTWQLVIITEIEKAMEVCMSSSNTSGFSIYASPIVALEVDLPPQADPIRILVPDLWAPEGEAHGQSATYGSVNRGKCAAGGSLARHRVADFRLDFSQSEYLLQGAGRCTSATPRLAETFHVPNVPGSLDRLRVASQAASGFSLPHACRP